MISACRGFLNTTKRMADTGVKARKRKKRERTVSRLGEPVMRGKAYVGNDLVDEVAKLKEVILFQ